MDKIGRASAANRLPGPVADSAHGDGTRPTRSSPEGDIRLSTGPANRLGRSKTEPFVTDAYRPFEGGQTG